VELGLPDRTSIIDAVPPPAVTPMGRFADDELDADLVALPAPSRTRGLTGVALMVTVLFLSAGLMVLYRGDLHYFAFATTVPRDLGVADRISVGDLEENEYVTLRGMPLAARAIRFRKLGQTGLFRVYPLAGQSKIFVERFSEDGTRSGRGRPHGIYSGRMMRFADAGAGYKSVRQYLEQRMGTPVPDDAWLLIDGEAPGDRYWTVAMYAMLVFFFGFNVIVLFKHSRPVKD
jgi:hypothetical protein